MPRSPLTTRNDRTIVIQPGEEGVIIRSDGVVDVLLAKGAKNLSPRGIALASSAYQCVNDPAFREKRVADFALFHTPIEGEA
jgi:hypothetical protein